MDICFLFQFWAVAIDGRINEYQHTIIGYKDEEIRCLREQLKKATGMGGKLKHYHRKAAGFSFAIDNSESLALAVTLADIETSSISSGNFHNLKSRVIRFT